jgi:hypothetical protein
VDALPMSHGSYTQFVFWFYLKTLSCFGRFFSIFLALFFKDPIPNNVTRAKNDNQQKNDKI